MIDEICDEIFKNDGKINVKQANMLLIKDTMFKMICKYEIKWHSIHIASQKLSTPSQDMVSEGVDSIIK